MHTRVQVGTVAAPFEKGGWRHASVTGTLQLPVWIAVPPCAWEHRVQIAAPFLEQKGTWAKVPLGLKHGVLLLGLICVCLVALHFSGGSLSDKVGGEKKHSVLREGRDGGSKQQHSL